MAKFNLKKAILENKATFHSSLNENEIKEGLTPLQQHVYDFESEVSGEDFAEEEKENIMNLKTIGDVKKYYTDYRGWMDDSSLREMLMDLLMNLSSEFPELKEAMDVAKDMTTQEAAGHAERFAKYMSDKEGGEFTVTAGSVEGPSFDLDLNGEKYDGGSYIILTNGDIVNMAIPNNPVYANISMLNEEEKPKTKMKKSELKELIKSSIMNEIALDIDNMEDAPESEVDFLAEIDAILAEADEEVAVDDTEVAVDGEENIDVDTTTEVDPNVKAVQDALTQAQAAAQKLGDPKLTDQIGNTITFFTRAHVVDKGAVAEADEMEEGKKEYYKDAEADDAEHIKALEKDMKDDKESSKELKETLLLQKRAGILTESQYKAKLNEITVGEFPKYLANALNQMVISGDNQLAIALDLDDDYLSPEFKAGKRFISGNNILISNDEYDISSKADKMETDYDSIQLNLPEIGKTELYYIWDPNA